MEIKDVNYVVIKPKDAMIALEDKIKTVHSVTQLPPIIIRGFLRQFNWQVDLFLEKFTECYDEMYRKYDIFDSEVQIINEDTSSDSCAVCFDTPEIALKGCRHHFCLDCLEKYVSLKIQDEMDSDVIKCPSYKCNLLLDDAFITQLISPKMFEKYQQRILENFIFIDTKLQRCPGTNCENIIRLLDAKTPSPIKCSCGHEFCFHCDFSTSHSPLPCALIKEWTALLLRFGKTPASTEWIQHNTKPCPKCNRPILKHEGCDNMHCTMCRHSFRWSTVNTHESKEKFFVPSDAPSVELKAGKSKSSNNGNVSDDKKYDLQKIDTCTTKYVAALATYMMKIPDECQFQTDMFYAFKALKMCNHLLLIAAILEFFTKDEHLLIFMYHEYELQQRVMELEKAVKNKLRTFQKKVLPLKRKTSDENFNTLINESLIKCRIEYDVLNDIVNEIAQSQNW